MRILFAEKMSVTIGNMHRKKQSCLSGNILKEALMLVFMASQTKIM